MSNLINLYIDESGTPYVGDPRYRFFLITATVMEPEEDELAGLLLSKWRTAYLTNPVKCFHAVDFFEDTVTNYKKRELRMTRRFNKAAQDLLKIMSFVDFRAEVYYVDLQKIRSKYRIGPPPRDPGKSAASIQRSLYAQQKQSYHQLVITQMGKKTAYYPLKMCLFESFHKHSQLLQSNADTKGCINFESLGPSDGRYVDIYHNYATSDNNYRYGNEIVEMNLHTKASTNGGGIEIADLVSYVSMQTLRFDHRLKNELSGISVSRIKQLKIIRSYMRTKLKIHIIDITDKAI